MLTWLPSRTAVEAATADLAPMRKAVENHLMTLTQHLGYCAPCNAVTRMRVRKRFQRGWVDLREALVCERCGLNGRMRMAWVALRDALKAAGASPRVLMLERVTPLFSRVAADCPAVEGSEFLASDARPGEQRRVGGIDVRHEDLLALSAGSDSLDLLFHGDVLEHVPDGRAALRECHRVLRPGGTLLFTVPFYGQERNEIRARLEHGRLVHLAPPSYHGNPVSAKGSLVFTRHGWELLEDLSAAGFARVETGLMYEPFQGIVSNNNPFPEGHMWPVMFRAVK